MTGIFQHGITGYPLVVVVNHSSLLICLLLKAILTKIQSLQCPRTGENIASVLPQKEKPGVCITVAHTTGMGVGTVFIGLSWEMGSSLKTIHYRSHKSVLDRIKSSFL